MGSHAARPVTAFLVDDLLQVHRILLNYDTAINTGKLDFDFVIEGCRHKNQTETKKARPSITFGR